MEAASSVVPLASLGNIEDPDVLVCCSCHRATTKDLSIVVVRAASKVNSKDVIRCKKCHALRARIDRLVARRGELEDWTSVSEEDKRMFYQECENACGQDLLMRMQEVILQSTKKTSLAQFTTTGVFLDLQDLEKKYKDKPAQLEEIVKNTRKMYCPLKKTTLYEDVSYQSKLADSEERTEERKRKVEYAEAPKPKAKAKAKAKAEAKTEENKLNAASKRKVSKKIEQVTAAKLQVQDTIKKASAHATLIPDYVIKNADGIDKKMEQALTDANKAIADGQGDVEDILEVLKDLNEKGTAAATKLRLQIQEAEKFLAETEQV